MRVRDEYKGRALQAAVVPYRWQQGHLQVAMITARNQPNRWVLPKGNIEPGETPRQSALREATEEAGLLGRIGHRPLGSYEYLKRGQRRCVLVFRLLVTRQMQRWSEDHFRERKWVRVDRAIKRARQRGLRAILRSLPDVL